MGKEVHNAQLLSKELERRAEAFGAMGGIGTTRVLAQADAAYVLYLDFLEAGHLGLDFLRWLSRHSGISYGTCWNRLKAGRARATGSKPNRNQAGLVAEMRERETTPVPELNWDEE